MGYITDYTEMLEGRYIDPSLYTDLKSDQVQRSIQRLTKDLSDASSISRIDIFNVLAIMNELFLFKLALEAKISSSFHVSDEGTKYLSARAAVTLKAKRDIKAKRIWTAFYLGPENDYKTNNGKIDVKKIRYMGREDVILKLVEKLKTESME